MQYRSIGDVQVSSVGLGAMPMSIEGRPDEAQAIETIHATLDAGVTLIDTADSYCIGGSDTGHNESLIAKALAAYGGDTSGIIVATKGGHTRPGDGSWGQNGHPAYLKEAAKASASRLGVDAIGLYQFHRPDPSVPFDDSIGALVELLDEGVIRMAGVSNTDVDQIRRANELLGGRLVSVQNQFSPAFRSSQGELELCAELGIAFLPWSPLGGIAGASTLGGKAAAFEEVAARHGVSPQRVCLAWELALAPVVVVIPGAKRAASIRDSAEAAELVLSPDEVAQLSA